MTTIPYRGVRELTERLQGVRVRRWLLELLAGLLATVAVGLAAAMLLGVTLGYWPGQPPSWMRWTLLLAALIPTTAAVGWFLLRPLVRRRNIAQTARQVEAALPEVRNDLINSLLLARDAGQVSPELVQRAIDEAVSRTESVDLHRSISLRSLRRWATAAAVAALVNGAFLLLQPGRMSRGLLAAVTPSRYVPHVNALHLASLTPGDATVFAGEPVAIVADLAEAPPEETPGFVHVEGRAEPLPMMVTEGGTRYATAPVPAEQSFRYFVRIGDSRWPSEKEHYTVSVVRRIEVEGLDLRYEYPDYIGWKPRSFPDAQGNIEAPIGTEVTVTLRLAAKAPGVLLHRQGAQPRRMKSSPDGRTWVDTFGVSENGRYRIVLTDPDGRPIQQVPAVDNDTRADVYSRVGQDLMAGSFTISALPDDKPTCSILKPGKDVSVSPGGELPLRIKATDKYGLTRVALLAGREGEEPKTVTDFPAVKLDGRTEILLDHTLKLEGYREGDVVVYYALATDNRQFSGLGGFQTQSSSRFRVLVQDVAKVAAARALRRDQLRRKLLAILEMQLEQRVRSAVALRKLARLSEVQVAGANLVQGQTRVRAALLELVAKFPFDQDTLPVQQACALLAGNEAAEAITHAEVLAKLARMEERNETCMKLIDAQERIIESLKSLLTFMPEMGKKPDARKAAPGGDLPPDTWEKYRKLKEDMEKFVAEQKKVIAASDRLAKTPVDSFQAEEKLKELIANQDKWEKFINEKFSDFSKLAEQDFSNSAVLKELISVKCDVTMAKDALQQKAAEIATAAEESGTENAKSLTANIEKWLPDKPDRTKWAMEAPEGQDNIEMPELPTELEDLVGDLLEEEEDLFEEMDDVTSKAAMSGDKGIGWDAMDGPISNMNAQGVTGNQLPNTNEMQGRSGEGRQGKSSGEFVEDKAVGKGGRRTPTRLTPEPFQKGQVDDKSTDPAGGATGGGKLSGAGEGGLEGPVPPDVKKDMKRLAGKQAALINKAERIQAMFKTNDYSAFRLREAVALMNRVKKDLDEGNYRNALRRRRATMSAIEQSKLMLSGTVTVTADKSAAMPKYVRDDIADAMKGKLPEEYKDVLQQYYKRLQENSR
ncbi:MAG: hypothetical protein ACLFV7_09485 [Phycisphaerae bacterium]